MEVAIGNSSTPFQREVREWQRIDPNTGHLLTARLEADRWISGPSNSYGKVSELNGGVWNSWRLAVSRRVSGQLNAPWRLKIPVLKWENHVEHRQSGH